MTRTPTARPRRTPMWALLVLLVISAALVPGFLAANSEDRALSGSTHGSQQPGGQQVSRTQNGTRTSTCRDAPVQFEVAGRRYVATTPVDGRCVAAGDTRPVTVRYDPDDPYTFTTGPRQRVLYGFVVAAALGFLVTLVAVLRRLVAHRRRRREARASVSPLP